MLGRFRGIKGYNQHLISRLPALKAQGIFSDLLLHVRIKPSAAMHIFVVGPPRSGTTLVRGMIAAHSCVATTDKETFFFNRRRISLFALDEIPDLKNILASATSKVEAFDLLANFVKQKHKVDHFLEKTPEHGLVLDNLLDWYPNSKFVFVIRDGRDAYSSVFRNPTVHSKVGHEYPRLWRDIVRCYIRNSSAANLKLLRYEQLTHNPRDVLEEVMGFIGLEFEDHQLDPFHYGKTSMAADKGHEMLVTKVNAGSVGAFRTRLSEDQIDFFRACAGVELKAMGYRD